MAEKIIKGLGLGAVFGIVAYLITKDLGVASVMALIMFMSMFVKNRN
ncbi:MAG: hypothetical protein J6I97_08270 [Agathobacter sp.]|nr:hypothetical protein [Agathobacter sp.]